MKRKIAALLFCIIFTGCALLEPAGPPEWRDSARSEAADPLPAETLPEEPGAEQNAPEAPDTEATLLEGVEGDYLLLEADDISANASLERILELPDMVIAALRPDSGEGLLLQGFRTLSGERAFAARIDRAYYVETTDEQPEDIRVVCEDGIRYLTSADSALEEVYTLPESVASQLYVAEETGAPYDYDRQADLLVYCGADGVYLSDGEGSDPRRVMSNEEAVRWFGYVGFELPPYTWDQVHFVAPRIMNGGEQVAATAWIEGAADDGVSGRCVYVSTVDVETGKYSNYPDPMAEAAAPAEKRDVNTLVAAGEYGYQTILVAEERITELPYEDALAEREERFVFEEGVVEGAHVFALVRYPDNAADGAMGEEMLVATEYDDAQLLKISANYLLCRLEAGASHLVLVYHGEDLDAYPDYQVIEQEPEENVDESAS